MKPFAVDDLFLYLKLTELHGVPARAEVAAVVRSVDRENDSYVSKIWLCPVDGREPRQLTTGDGEDSSPRWSPGGERIAFVSARGGGKPELRLIDSDGGESRSCGEATAGVSAHRWLPDGKALLVTLMLDVDPDLRGQRGKPPAQRSAAEPELAWRLPYKQDGAGYVLAREVHLFHFDPPTGARKQLTDGPFDVHGFDPSPDGQRVVCSASWIKRECLSSSLEPIQVRRLFLASRSISVGISHKVQRASAPSIQLNSSRTLLSR